MFLCSVSPYVWLYYMEFVFNCGIPFFLPLPTNCVSNVWPEILIWHGIYVKRTAECSCRSKPVSYLIPSYIAVSWYLAQCYFKFGSVSGHFRREFVIVFLCFLLDDNAVTALRESVYMTEVVFCS